MKFLWSLAPPQPLLAGQLARELKIPPLLAQCLLNRGFTEPTSISGFLEPRLKNLADPFLLPNMAAAVDRLYQSRERNEPVLIFGDYDVDGVTSTVLLLEVLTKLGWRASHYLPNRLEEGYGLSLEALDNCLRQNTTSLLLAVDCGSTAYQSIEWLRQRGVDVIVLDHHQVAEPLPRAVALVNPQLLSQKPQPSAPGSAGNGMVHFNELCSVGLAFKLSHALVKRGREMSIAAALELDLRGWLDLVALGTIADVVPLVGENRILVSAGLAKLQLTRRPGLIALKKIAQCATPLGVYEVGYQLGPRLNAAGRLETADAALRLLRAPDMNQALTLAQELDACNRERQNIERSIAEKVIASMRTRFRPDEHFVIIEGNQDWHIGVVGIVASRVLQEFYRPTIIVGGGIDEWRGSGRSVAGFDLAAALRECDDLLLRHGGHAMAAGLALKPSNLEALRARLNQLARQTLRPNQLLPPLLLDGEVGLNELTVDNLEVLSKLRPEGEGNPTVRFVASRVAHARPLQRMGTDKQHVKMWVTDGATCHEAVWWGAGEESLPVGKFDLAFAPQINRYSGRCQVQLKVLDWRTT